MGFEWVLELTVPANTTKANAKLSNLRELVAGSLIYKILVHVPQGNQSTTPFWLQLGPDKVIPTHPDGEFKLDDAAAFPILEPPIDYKPIRTDNFALAAYNTDTVNPHTLRAFVYGLYPSEILAAERRRIEIEAEIAKRRRR